MRFDFIFTIIAKIKSAWLMLTIGIVIGMMIMGYLRRPEPIPAPKPDQALPGEVLPNGSTLVEVKPPVAILPPVQGKKEEMAVVRHVEVVVRPDPIIPSLPASPDLSLPVQPKDIKVSLDLVRLPNGHLRVVASAEGGQVINSIDIPVISQPITTPSTQKTAREYRWAVLAERIIPAEAALAPTWGAQVLYTRGPVVLGIAGNRYEGRVSAGFRW